MTAATCHHCGAPAPELTLGQRSFRCAYCETANTLVQPEVLQKGSSVPLNDAQKTAGPTSTLEWLVVLWAYIVFGGAMLIPFCAFLLIALAFAHTLWPLLLRAFAGH